MKAYSPMKIVSLFILLLCALHRPDYALAAPALVDEINIADAFASNWFTSNTTPLPSGLTQYAFRSPSNNADVGYSVYLPPSYAANPTKRFPVV
jgi:hypothetical protein